MQWNWTRLIFIVVSSGFLVTPGPVWSMGVNEFYRCFLGNLKDSRYSQLEQLVRNNQEMARKSLAILDRKLQDEKDPGRKEAYSVIVREMEELIAVVEGRKNCQIGGRITQRAQRAPLPEDALEGFRRAAMLCPDNLDAALGMAESNSRLGKFDGTIAAYETVLAMKPDVPEAVLGMGEVLYSAGLYERSIPFLEQALRLEPDRKKAKALLVSCTKESALDRQGIIPSEEIMTRLVAPLEGGLMCMCPAHAQLVSRIRFRSITFSMGSTGLDAIGVKIVGV